MILQEETDLPSLPALLCPDHTLKLDFLSCKEGLEAIIPTTLVSGLGEPRGTL